MHHRRGNQQQLLDAAECVTSEPTAALTLVNPNHGSISLAFPPLFFKCLEKGKAAAAAAAAPVGLAGH